MRSSAQLLLIAGVGVGAVAAIGSAVAQSSALWSALAATATLALTGALLLTLGLRRPAPGAAPPGPPRLVDRLRAATAGDPLARQYVLESLDRLRATRPGPRARGRLATDPALYRLSSHEFVALVATIVTQEEAVP